MSSPVFTFYNQIKRDNFCKIFGKYDGFNRGEHTRDFIYISNKMSMSTFSRLLNKTIDYVFLSRLIHTSVLILGVKLICLQFINLFFDNYMHSILV